MKLTKESFQKVRAGDYNVRYIDTSGKWWRKHFNGQWTKSRPMPITKEYGTVTLEIENDEIYGKKVME